MTTPIVSSGLAHFALHLLIHLALHPLHLPLPEALALSTGLTEITMYRWQHRRPCKP